MRDSAGNQYALTLNIFAIEGDLEILSTKSRTLRLLAQPSENAVKYGYYSCPLRRSWAHDIYGNPTIGYCKKMQNYVISLAKDQCLDSNAALETEWLKLRLQRHRREEYK
tara:strand:- start:375 stop:704 length:330 start_codon:yes stop_codon:yes gene_type:complete